MCEVKRQIETLHEELQASSGIPYPAHWVGQMVEVAKTAERSLSALVDLKELRIICVKQLREYVQVAIDQQDGTLQECYNHAVDQLTLLFRLTQSTRNLTSFQLWLNKVQAKHELKRR